MKLEIPKMERLQDGTDLVTWQFLKDPATLPISAQLFAASASTSRWLPFISAKLSSLLWVSCRYTIYLKKKHLFQYVLFFPFPEFLRNPFWCLIRLPACLFICFWLHWVFIAARRLSLVATSGGYFLIKVFGLLTEVASPIAEQALHTCASVAVTLSSRAQAQ